VTAEIYSQRRHLDYTVEFRDSNGNMQVWILPSLRASMPIFYRLIEEPHAPTARELSEFRNYVTLVPSNAGVERIMRIIQNFIGCLSLRR